MGRQRADSPGIRLKIVDQQSGRQLDLFGEAGLLDHPRQVRGFHSSVPDRAGNPETRSLRASSGVFKKLGDNLAKLGVFAAGEDLFGDKAQISVLRLK